MDEKKPGGAEAEGSDPRRTEGGARFVFSKELGWPPRRGRGQRVPPRSYLLTLDFDQVVGRLECVRFELRSTRDQPDGRDPVPVTASALRGVPLGSLIDQALFEGTKALRRWAREARPGGPQWRHLRDRVAAAEASLGRGPGRPPLYTEDHFKAVADAYTRAFTIGGRPRKAVADAWQVSPSTAAKWVARAREMGFLPPTGQGRAAGGAARGKTAGIRRGAHRRGSKKVQEIERLEEREAYELEVLREHEAWLAKLTGLPNAMSAPRNAVKRSGMAAPTGRREN